MHTLKQPHWLRKRINNNANLNFTKSVLAEFGINTVCQSARCPNIFDCFSKRRATFLILGNTCTRNCAFCSVEKGRPEALDKNEPNRVAEVASVLGLRHIVITSVTRDDLSDGGSEHFVKTIEAIRKRSDKNIFSYAKAMKTPLLLRRNYSDGEYSCEAKLIVPLVLRSRIDIEVLVPDFKGNKIDIKRVVDAKPDIFSHNLETVPSKYKKIRPGADYQRSIDVLGFAREIDPDLITKSGFMLGLGETEEEIIAVMRDLRMADCNMLAIGQYLRPSTEQIEVKEFITPVEFSRLKKIGYSIGFKSVQSGPFVRSSYRHGLNGLGTD